MLLELPIDNFLLPFLTLSLTYLDFDDRNFEHIYLSECNWLCRFKMLTTCKVSWNATLSLLPCPLGGPIPQTDFAGLLFDRLIYYSILTPDVNFQVLIFMTSQARLAVSTVALFLSLACDSSSQMFGLDGLLMLVSVSVVGSVNHFADLPKYQRAALLFKHLDLTLVCLFSSDVRRIQVTALRPLLLLSTDRFPISFVTEAVAATSLPRKLV